jgi:hypothetical protein
MHVGKTAAIGVERQFFAGGGAMPGNEAAGLAARHEAEIFEAVDRQMRTRIIVTPAEAGVQGGRLKTLRPWIPAFAGMTGVR